MAALARAGVGIALVDCYLGDRDDTLWRVVPEPVIVDELWAVVHVDMYRAPRVRATIDFLTEVVAADAALLEGGRSR